MDTIGNFLSRIRNAYLAGKEEILAPHSKGKESLAVLLVAEGYLASFDILEQDDKKKLSVQLKYNNNKPALSKIKRVSKPGRRFYSSADKIPWTVGGLGLTIVSTPKGLCSDKKARKQNMGGEIICQIFP